MDGRATKRRNKKGRKNETKKKNNKREINADEDISFFRKHEEQDIDPEKELILSSSYSYNFSLSNATGPPCFSTKHILLEEIGCISQEIHIECEIINAGFLLKYLDDNDEDPQDVSVVFFQEADGDEKVHLERKDATATSECLLCIKIFSKRYINLDDEIYAEIELKANQNYPDSKISVCLNEIFGLNANSYKAELQNLIDNTLDETEGNNNVSLVIKCIYNYLSSHSLKYKNNKKEKLKLKNKKIKDCFIEALKEKKNFFLEEKNVCEKGSLFVEKVCDVNVKGNKCKNDNMNNFLMKKSSALVDYNTFALLKKFLRKHFRYFRDFEELKLLGSGGFGSVAKVMHRVGQEIYAIKKIEMQMDGNEKCLAEEAMMLAKLHHRHIVRYYDAWIESGFIDRKNEFFLENKKIDEFFSSELSNRINRQSSTEVKYIHGEAFATCEKFSIGKNGIAGQNFRRSLCLAKQSDMISNISKFKEENKNKTYSSNILSRKFVSSYKDRLSRCPPASVFCHSSGFSSISSRKSLLSSTPASCLGLSLVPPRLDGADDKMSCKKKSSSNIKKITETKTFKEDECESVIRKENVPQKKKHKSSNNNKKKKNKLNYNSLYYFSSSSGISIKFHDEYNNDSSNHHNSNHKNNLYNYNSEKKRMASLGCRKCYLFILMEYCPGKSLREYIDSYAQYPLILCNKNNEKKQSSANTSMNHISNTKSNSVALHKNPSLIWILSRQILEGLEYMHDIGIIHRDIKPSNIFLKEDDEGGLCVKIGDFGLTRNLQATGKRKVECVEKAKQFMTSDQLSAGVGTMYYMAPEQEKGTSYDQKADIFSIGIVFFEMWHPPFKTAMERAVVLCNLSRHNKFPEEFVKIVDNRVIKMLKRLTSHNPVDRPSAYELLHSDFILPSSTQEFSTVYDVISNHPFSNESIQLMASIFSRVEKQDKSYFYNSDRFDRSAYVICHEVRRRFENIYKLRGAIHFSSPILEPISFHVNNSQNQQTEKKKREVRDTSFSCVDKEEEQAAFQGVFSNVLSNDYSVDKAKEATLSTPNNTMLLEQGENIYSKHSRVQLSASKTNSSSTAMDYLYTSVGGAQDKNLNAINRSMNCNKNKVEFSYMKKNFHKIIRLLDSAGTPLYLPFQLIYSFARSAAHIDFSSFNLNFCIYRRWDFTKIYRNKLDSRNKLFSLIHNNTTNTTHANNNLSSNVYNASSSYLHVNHDCNNNKVNHILSSNEINNYKKIHETSSAFVSNTNMNQSNFGASHYSSCSSFNSSSYPLSPHVTMNANSGSVITEMYSTIYDIIVKKKEVLNALDFFTDSKNDEKLFFCLLDAELIAVASHVVTNFSQHLGRCDLLWSCVDFLPIILEEFFNFEEMAAKELSEWIRCYSPAFVNQKLSEKILDMLCRQNIFNLPFDLNSCYTASNSSCYQASDLEALINLLSQFLRIPCYNVDEWIENVIRFCGLEESNFAAADMFRQKIVDTSQLCCFPLSEVGIGERRSFSAERGSGGGIRRNSMFLGKKSVHLGGGVDATSGERHVGIEKVEKGMGAGINSGGGLLHLTHNSFQNLNYGFNSSQSGISSVAANNNKWRKMTVQGENRIVEILQKIKFLHNLIHSLEGFENIIFEFALHYDTDMFANGVVFYVMTEISSCQKKKEIFAIGGRYEKLVKTMNGSSRGLACFAVEIAAEMIIRKLMEKERNSYLHPSCFSVLQNSLVSHLPRVLITVNKIDLHLKAFSLRHRLVNLGISCERELREMWDFRNVKKRIQKRNDKHLCCVEWLVCIRKNMESKKAFNVNENCSGLSCGNNINFSEVTTNRSNKQFISTMGKNKTKRIETKNENDVFSVEYKLEYFRNDDKETKPEAAFNNENDVITFLMLKLFV